MSKYTPTGSTTVVATGPMAPVIDGADDGVGVVVEIPKGEELELELELELEAVTEAMTETVLTSTLELPLGKLTLLEGYAVMRLLLCPKETATLVVLMLVLAVLLGMKLPLDADVVDPKAM